MRGLGLAVAAIIVAAIIVACVDHATANVPAHHIRAGCPTYAEARIDTAVTICLVRLSVVGALGFIGWLWTIRAVKAGKRWSRGAAIAMFALAPA